MATKATRQKKSTQRKLTAILCADVVGYSRLMGEDEETLAWISRELLDALLNGDPRQFLSTPNMGAGFYPGRVVECTRFDEN